MTRPIIPLAPDLTEHVIHRFNGHVTRGDGCWTWGAYHDGDGYGRFGMKINGRWRTVKAHRVAYTIAHGEIPDGLHLDHLCRNTGCVNPTHLEAVTNRTNTLRGYGWGGIHGRKTHCPRGHEYTPENTMTKPTSCGIGRECRECARALRRAKNVVPGGLPCHLCDGTYATRRALRVHLGKHHGQGIRQLLRAAIESGAFDPVEFASQHEISLRHVRAELRVLPSPADRTAA